MFYSLLKQINNKALPGKNLITVLMSVIILSCLFSGCQMTIVEYVPGEIVDEENAYVNDFFKVRFECPEGYIMSRTEITDGELKEMFGNKYVGDSSRVYQELNVKSSSSLSNMTVVVQRGTLDLSGRMVQSILNNFVQSTIGNIGGVTCELGEPYEDYLGGQTFQAIDVDIDVQGYPMRMTILAKSEKGYTMLMGFCEVNESINDLFEGLVDYK